MKIIPENILKKMSTDERKKLGKAGVTADEAQASFVARNEKELQRQIGALLRRNGVWFDQDATHKRRTGTKGTPDFLFAVYGKPVAWEVKFKDGKLSDDQINACMLMEENGWNCFTITSLEQAQIVLRTLSEGREG